MTDAIVDAVSEIAQLNCHPGASGFTRKHSAGAVGGPRLFVRSARPLKGA
jgi:hypothetical protein